MHVKTHIPGRSLALKLTCAHPTDGSFHESQQSEQLVSALLQLRSVLHEERDKRTQAEQRCRFLQQKLESTQQNSTAHLKELAEQRDMVQRLTSEVTTRSLEVREQSRLVMQLRRELGVAVAQAKSRLDGDRMSMAAVQQAEAESAHLRDELRIKVGEC